MPVEMAIVDPFDLPDWLGTSDVVWRYHGTDPQRHWLSGSLCGDSAALECDLLAVDEAYPMAVCDEDTRVRVHHAWRSSEVLIGTHQGRLTLAVPGTRLGPEITLRALGRFAKAVGARPDRYSVLLRVAEDSGR